MWLYGEVKTPPMSSSARVDAGVLLRRLQRGESLGLPHSRPMPKIGRRCHELRVVDGEVSWRVAYRLDFDAVVMLDVFKKKSQSTPRRIIEACRQRVERYHSVAGEEQ